LVIFDLQMPATVFDLPAATSLFVVSFTFNTVELSHLLPLFPSKNDHILTSPLPYFHLP
jgi:hypothetical protein